MHIQMLQTSQNLLQARFWFTSLNLLDYQSIGNAKIHNMQQSASQTLGQDQPLRIDLCINLGYIIETIGI